MLIRSASVAVSIAALAACRAPHTRATERDAAPPSIAGTATDGGASDAETREPLGGDAEVELLDGKERLGFVSVPVGARAPRPIMIALHGGSDRPERACASWRGISEAYPFVVCPRGFGGNEAALGWRGVADTSDRIARAIAATKAIFGGWIHETPSFVLAGFSMGGSQVALLAGHAPRAYPRVVVGDSAHDPAPALGFSRAWAAGGGERAIFLCTTSGCEPSMRAAARKVAADKLFARLNVAPTQVHALSAPVVQSMRRDFGWLVDGAEGWIGYVPPSQDSLPGRTETFDPR
ncbi:MAG: hypothetical protein KF819_32915 [Labilithrix sp.]|nr:hypothetical protein [Labilithrix sp.]